MGESQYTAELFAKLLPWLDVEHPDTLLMLDEGGQNKVAKPDMVLRLRGAMKSVRIEVKVGEKTSPSGPVTMKIQNLQVRSWVVPNTPDAPDFWIVVMKHGVGGRSYAMLDHAQQVLPELVKLHQKHGAALAKRGWKRRPVPTSMISEGEFWREVWDHLYRGGFTP